MQGAEFRVAVGGFLLKGKAGGQALSFRNLWLGA